MDRLISLAIIAFLFCMCVDIAVFLVSGLIAMKELGKDEEGD